ncbi:MAG TPA: Ig-like domain-containing protein, partial [Burkholderiaceae bacterium]
AGGAAVTVTSGGVTEGTVSLSADGKNLVFTPANGYTGPATFTYTIDDGHNGTSTASVTINVDHPLVATADVTSTDFNTTATVAVLGNDSDADGDTLTITQVAGQAITAGGAAVTVTSGGVTEGTVSLSADGKNLVFTPANGYSGPATFTYTIDDGHNGTSTASVTVNVDHPPVANPETFYTFMNQAAATPVLATATDPDGDTLTVTAINGTAIDAAHPVTTAHGVVSMDAGGNLTFTPATGYTGADSFTYTIDDGHGATSTATATVEVDATPSLQITANAYAVATNFEEVTLPAAGWTDAAVTQLGTGGTAASEGGAGVWHTDNAGNVVEIGTAATYSVLNYSSQVLELEANVNDASNLYTNLTTRAGELYTLSFDYAARNNNGAVTNSTVYVYWEGQLVDTLNTQSAQLTHYSLTLLATTTGANQLEFVAGDSNSYGGVLDNVQFGVQQNTGEQGYVVDLPQIAASVANTSGTETLSSVTLDSIPVGATLTDGTHTFTASAGSQVADITGWNMDSLSLTPTASLTGNLTLGVHAVATETATGITSQVDSSITLDVAADSGNVYGTAGDDTLTITDASIGSSSIRWGLDGNDSIVGSIGHDTLVGGAGNDTLVAGSGSTLLDGGTGNDSLVGGTGSDTLSGGAGNDTLTGGDGSDVFKWHLGDQGTTAVPAKDTITDFNTAAASSGGDVLDLRDLLVGESRPAGTTGAGDLTNYLHFSYANGDTTIHISTTGSVGTGEDQQIVLSGVDLVGTNTDAQIITTLLGEGKLITNGH